MKTGVLRSHLLYEIFIVTRSDEYTVELSLMLITENRAGFKSRTMTPSKKPLVQRQNNHCDLSSTIAKSSRPVYSARVLIFSF